MEIEKNKYRMIGENAFLCRVARWGTEAKDEDYIYAVGINSSGKYEDFMGLTIYGFGETSEEAMLMAIVQLTECGLKSIPFSTLKDWTIPEFIEEYMSAQGHIDSPKTEPRADVSKQKNPECYGTDPGFSITLHDNECYPFMA